MLNCVVWRHILLEIEFKSKDGRYYRHGIEITDTYESIDTFDTRKKYR